MYKVCSPRYSTEKNKYQFTYPPIPKKTVRCLERRPLDWYIGMFILMYNFSSVSRDVHIAQTWHFPRDI